MIKSVLSLVVASGLLVSTLLIFSCSGEKEQPKEGNHQQMMGDSVKDHHKMGMGSKQMDSTNLTYVCPMHPEEKGMKGDKCPKCGMNMEPVKEHDHDDEHDHDR